MSAREGCWSGCSNWAVGALGGVRSPCGPATDRVVARPAHDEERDDRRDHEREIELRVLMSTWM